MYTVKQIADLAGISVRTLHYYDEIDLLTPTSVGENGYRYYTEDDLLRLQQILFYRELDIKLRDIKAIIDSPDFDLLAALHTHRSALQAKIQRYQQLIYTIDDTLAQLEDDKPVSHHRIFAGFSDEQQDQYEQEVAQYAPETVEVSVQRWNGYTAQEQERIREEGDAIYQDFVAAMHTGPDSADVQAILSRWHQHIRYFYEPTPDMLRGLGWLYNSHPDFVANFEKLHPDLPAFLQQAITCYCERLAEKTS